MHVTLLLKIRELLNELDTGFDNSFVGSSMLEKLGSPRLHGGPTLTAYVKKSDNV